MSAAQLRMRTAATLRSGELVAALGVAAASLDRFPHRAHTAAR